MYFHLLLDAGDRVLLSSYTKGLAMNLTTADNPPKFSATPREQALWERMPKV